VAGVWELVVSEEMTPAGEPSVDEQLAKELVARARRSDRDGSAGVRQPARLMQPA